MCIMGRCRWDQYGYITVHPCHSGPQQGATCGYIAPIATAGLSAMIYTVVESAYFLHGEPQVAFC